MMVVIVVFGSRGRPLLWRAEAGLSGKQRCVFIIRRSHGFHDRYNVIVGVFVMMMIVVVLLHLFLMFTFLLAMSMIAVDHVRRDEMMHYTGKGLNTDHSREKEANKEVRGGRRGEAALGEVFLGFG